MVQYAVVEDITGMAHMRIQGREVYGATENHRVCFLIPAGSGYPWAPYHVKAYVHCL